MIVSSANRRAVVVHRPTDYELLLATHATRGQAEFFLNSRSQSIDPIEQEHARIHSAIAEVLTRLPSRWRRASVSRPEFNRFLFEPEDIIIAIGQDGLVANISKYLTGQLVIGVNPLPERFDGPLVRFAVPQVPDLLTRLDAGKEPPTRERTMVEASLDDGQLLVALNEVYLGHRSHQSSRYRIRLDSREERQSSSGLIACTGTGATGWASSINRAYGSQLKLPAPTDARLSFFVREAWPSKATGTSLTAGTLESQSDLALTSEMNEGGVIFGDGIEDDYLNFAWGRTARVRIAQQKLRLVE